MADKTTRYKIEKEIGRGAFGVVFLAHDSKLDRKVALKFMDIPEGLTDEEIEHLQSRFYREARAAASLSHPNIVVIHDISQSKDKHFISMEYLEGRPLSRAVGEPMDVETALELAKQMLSALDYAHERGVVHRDVKPDNVFLLDNDKVKLVDFGLARLLTTTSMTRSGSVMGSPGYIAPEVIEGKKADGRTDIFSFGVVLYEMLTGSRPFGPFTAFESYATVIYRILSEAPEKPSSINPGVEPWLDDLIERCMLKDPDERFASAGEIIEVIETRGEAPARRSAPAPRKEVPAGKVTTAVMKRSRGETRIVEGEDGAREDAGGGRRRLSTAVKVTLVSVGALALAGIVVLVLFLAGVFAGASQVKSPNLINLEESKAVSAIEQAGLKPGKKTTGFSFDIWKGKIMRQFPEAGKVVPGGSSIDYWVSLGNSVVQVPEVNNEPEADAARTLTSYGLKIKRIEGFSGAVQVGYVFRLVPKPGTLVATGDTVRMTVSKGAPGSVPASGPVKPTPPRSRASQPPGTQ